MAAHRGTRFTVIDKETGAIVRRAEAEACFAFHHVNAYEENGAVMADVVAFDDPRIIDALSLKELRSGKTLPQGVLTRFAIPLDNAAVAQTTFGAVAIELPRISYRRLAGRRHRYVWGIGDSGSQSIWDSIVKQDTETSEFTSWSAGNTFPGEPVFVEAPGREGEDNGALLSVVLDGNRHCSFLLVLDAASLQERARAYLPHAIPFGFHGNYFSAKS
ncbi:MAG TPA: carotenoid oxygenase family protein [Methylocella sp.]|nr:carotenoid oxygenase family protein [Methylocella sp.]